jgi:acyl carrier protein
MNKAAIKSEIAAVLAGIAPEAELDEVPADQNLREELDIDSYDFLSLLIGLNEQLGVDIPEADYEKLVTLDNLIDYLAERLD